MKKLLLISIIAFTGFVNAQEIRLISPLTVTNGLITPPNTDVTNDTITYCVSDLNSLFDGGEVFVINNSASSMGVEVKRFGNQYACYSSNQFCWTICYAAATSVSPDSIVIAPYDTTTVFHGWVDPNGTDGCCFIKYRFFDTYDTATHSDVTIKYCFSANCSSPNLGTNDLSATDFNFYPNPAQDFITMDFEPMDKNGVVSIMDLTGKMAKQINVPSNTSKLVIPLEGLSNGVYLCSFAVDGKSTITKKIIVRK